MKNLKDINDLNALFEASAQAYANRTAFVNMDVALSYADIHSLSDTFAAFLQQVWGLEKNDKIALQMPNVLPYPVALMGALKAGLTVVNVNPLYTEVELHHQLKDADVKAIIVLENFADKIETILEELPFDDRHVMLVSLSHMLPPLKAFLVNLVVRYVKNLVPRFTLRRSITFSEALKMGAQQNLRPVPVSSDDLAFLQYTGGTTGKAKGAMLSHGNIMANLNQVNPHFTDIFKDEIPVIITPLPMYHIFALTCNVLLCIA